MLSHFMFLCLPYVEESVPSLPAPPPPPQFSFSAPCATTCAPIPNFFSSLALGLGILEGAGHLPEMFNQLGLGQVFEHDRVGWRRRESNEVSQYVMLEFVA